MFQQAEEKELANAIGVARLEADLAIVREDFAAAMTAIAKLRPHVDAFFDKVTVNVDDVVVRSNRLRLLNEIRVATLAVADFSKIEDKPSAPDTARDKSGHGVGQSANKKKSQLRKCW